jgi:putative phosphonate metabolism protein
MPVADQHASGRYAIYWAPPASSTLARLGSAWLGREAEQGTAGARPPIPGFAAVRLEALTAEPRRYGLHATLKPPFALAEGTDPGALRQALAACAAGWLPMALPPLQVTLLERFIALTPRDHSPGLHALANGCLVDLDRFRAPPAAAELARRRAAGLSPLEESYLMRWGYPYVLEHFRFHVTLTGPLEPVDAERLLPALARLFEPATHEALLLTDIALFHEPAPGAPFRLVERFGLRGT